MAKKTKKAGENFFAVRLARVNTLLEKFEKEVEKTLKKVVKKSEVTSKEVLKNFDEIAAKISQTELYSKANESKQALEKEIRRLTEDLVARVKHFDTNITKPFLRDLKTNVDQIIENLAKNDLVEIAIDRVGSTRDQILNVLNIPSQTEVEQLSRKLAYLERKVKVLSTKKTGNVAEEAAA